MMAMGVWERMADFCSGCLECENSDFSQATAQEKVSHDSSGMRLSYVECVFVFVLLDLLKILVLTKENEFDYSNITSMKVGVSEQGLELLYEGYRS